MKNYMRYFKTIPAVMAIALALPAMAVTEKEMEEARAITAKAYLRYANDGSGYLDDVQAKSMSELTGKLKEKEKENLKAFNKVKVPSDYASWDKARLVEFWGVTFFTSPELSEKGKAARSRVKKQINSMNISAPAPETPAPSPAAESETLPAATAAADTAPLPTAETVVAEEQDILADQKAIMEDADESAATPREESHTWVYVLVLAILIAVVIWLVVFAAKLMKKQPDGTPESMAADNEELREKARKAIARKNEELEAMRVRMEEAERNESELSRKAEALKAENRQLLEQAEALRLENSRLKGEALAAQTAQTTRPAAQPQAPQPRPRQQLRNLCPRRPPRQPGKHCIPPRHQRRTCRNVQSGRCSGSGRHRTGQSGAIPEGRLQRRRLHRGSRSREHHHRKRRNRHLRERLLESPQKIGHTLRMTRTA